MEGRRGTAVANIWVVGQAVRRGGGGDGEAPGLGGGRGYA